MNDFGIAGLEILVVEDEIILRKRICAHLGKQGLIVTAAKNIEEAKNYLAGMIFDFALVDLNLPDGHGMDLLKENKFSDNTNVIIMTAEGGIKSAVEAMRLGARNYLTKPFELDELQIVIKRCSREVKNDRIREFEKSIENSKSDAFYFGSKLEIIKQQLEKTIQADKRLKDRLPPILIEGETGTGKTAIAKWLHNNGSRSDKQLVHINCSALPETLAESELFGHERGAFTDAKQARIGLFEAADNGTLFLDEIPSLSLPIQAKILTAIEEGKIRRVGGNKEISVNVRLITATNKDLKLLSSEKNFREDLYHRLNLISITLPPLRERNEDIIILAEHILIDFSNRYGNNKFKLSDANKESILNYSWPGNVRELSHEIERAIIMGDGQNINFSHLTYDNKNSESIKLNLNRTDWLNPDWSIPAEGFKLEEAIDKIIERALEQEKNNVSAAARILGVKRDYLRYRISQKGSD